MSKVNRGLLRSWPLHINENERQQKRKKKLKKILILELVHIPNTLQDLEFYRFETGHNRLERTLHISRKVDPDS